MQLAELGPYPHGRDPFKDLAVIDYGDCFVNPHMPWTVTDTIVEHARTIIKAGARMLTFGGDHYVTYPLVKGQHVRGHTPATPPPALTPAQRTLRSTGPWR